MTEKEHAYLEGFDYANDIGYAQYLDRKTEETKKKALKFIKHFLTSERRLYNCGGLPVEVTLPEGEHMAMQRNIKDKNNI